MTLKTFEWNISGENMIEMAHFYVLIQAAENVGIV